MQKSYRRPSATLLLHLVDKLISCNDELLLNNIAHRHQIFETLLKYCVNTDAV
jgi:hypothetical protein